MAAAQKTLLIDGSVSSGFEPVREAFVENFTRRGELGAACCIYEDGEKVVDLWGGVRDGSAVSRGVRTRWSSCTRRQRASRRWSWRLRTRAAGWTTTSVSARIGPSSRKPARSESRSASCWLIRQDCSPSTRRSTARSSPTSIDSRRSWRGNGRPGSRASGRHITRSVSASTKASSCAASTRASQPGPVFRRGDRRAARTRFLHRSAGVGPGYAARAARAAKVLEATDRVAARLTLAAMNRRSVLVSIVGRQPGTGFYVDRHRSSRPEPRGPVGRRRRYCPRDRKGLRCVRRRRPRARTTLPRHRSARGARDPVASWLLRRVLARARAKFSLGFMKPSESFPFGHAGAFGAPGAGGSMGYADPRSASATAT